MPYARGYIRRRRRYKKKSGFFKKAGRFIQGATSAMGVAYSAYRLAKRANSLINVEKKFIDTANTVSTSTTPAITPLTLVAEGDDYNQRNGRSIKLSSLQCRYYINANATATISYMLRVLIIIDKDSRGSAPTASEIFQDSTNFNTPINLNNGKRFVVLFDKVTDVSPSGAYTDDALKWKQYYKKLSMHTTFMGTGATQADADNNHIYLVYMATGGANPPGFSYYFRTRFIDN